MIRALATWAIGLFTLLSPCAAQTVLYTEDFTNNVANWADDTGTSLLTHGATGGPDGGSYASTTLSLFNRGDTDVVLFRAHDEFNSSNHEFEGNWIGEVNSFSTYVRHSVPFPVNFFTRFSGPGNFPGAVAVKFIPVLPNTWTRLTFDIRPDNPEFVTFEGMNFGSVFSNIGHIQVGLHVPSALGANPAAFTFAIDKPSIAVPEPTSIAASALGVLLLGCVRRRRG